MCGVSFENLPVWLWTIRPTQWSTIFITRPDEARLRQAHPELWNRLSDKFLIVAKSVVVDSQAILADVWWISGSETFINGLNFPSSMALVIWVGGSGRRLPGSLIKKDAQIQWTHLNHCRVGGVTNARGWFGARGLNKIDIPTDLHRTLAHVLKHSIRGKPCDAVPSGRHYTPTDRLSINLIDQHIVYPTFLSHTGWAQRPLDPVELAMSFELPEYVVWNPSFARAIVPLQLFRTVIDHVLEQLGPFSPPPRKTPRCTTSNRETSLSRQMSEEAHEDRIWLPSINKWLSGTWAAVDIASRAVKSDNAAVDYRPWHLRISLALPCQPPTLDVISRLAMRRWRLNIVNSFFSYMRHQYGSQWQTKFFSGCQLRVPADASFRPSLSRLGLKRRHSDSAATAEIGSTLSEDGGGALIATVLSGASGTVGGVEVNWEQMSFDVSKGLLVIGQILQSTWWEWNKGSSLLFWRWNGSDQIRAARDGMPIFVQSSLPRSDRKVKMPKFSDADRPLVAAKINGMIQKGYLELGKVRTSLHYFAVPKGADDIRIVYDGTSCGLNESLWSPNFFLPTARTAELLLSFGSWMADVDFGEFFHNFHMDERIRQHSGVNVKPLAPFIDSAGQINSPGAPQLRWSRLFMGMMPSPYNSVRHYYWGEEFARGDISDTLTNPFGYDQIVLNLPGGEGYDPTSPKIYKWNSKRRCISGDVVAFVDDVRITASSKEMCHEVHRQFTSRMQYLGFQDAPRKFRPPSQTNAGAWTGTIFSVGSKVISKTVSQEKWNKGRSIVAELKLVCDQADGNRPSLGRKQLERSTGFLNHLATTFDVMTPYLKGFYLTLNSWRLKRNSEDWKVSDKMWVQLLTLRLEEGLISNEEFDTVMTSESSSHSAPNEVVASPRFAQDVGALLEMFKADAPPVVGLRSKHIVTVVYGFGDASGTGLGATFTCGSGLTFRIGVWGATESEQSSNWREFSNVVDSLEEEARSGNLDDSEVFMFTDNSTVESCAVKGSSSSVKLFELVVRLRCLTTEFGIKLHIFHVAGTRMIAQGTDGVSRGFLGAGVMSGESMTSFIPIHLGAIERSETLKDWIIGWTQNSSAIFLLPKDWFDVAHDIQGWNPGWDGFLRPGLSEGVIPGNCDQRQGCSQWRGRCETCGTERKWTFGIFCSNFGSNVTGLETCQRMWCGECYSSDPDLKFHIADPENLVSEDGDDDRLRSGWTVKRIDRKRFCVARDGDDLLVSFECDTCVFAKVYKRLPIVSSRDDSFCLGCIRRVNLDAFWSRARTTVVANTLRFREMTNMSRTMGFDPPYSDPGPLPSYDHCGYRVAILMVAKSLQSGRYSDTHHQWDTIRKFRSTYSNQVRASRVANSTTWTLADNKGMGYQRITADPCGSLWFYRFMAGCQKRMGQDWRPNRAISNQILTALLDLTESKILMSGDDTKERDKWIMAGSYFCFCYVLSLRSPEGLLVDLKGLIEFNRSGEHRSFVIVPLLGQVKGEDHTRQHLLHCVNTTDSGISVILWVRRLLAIHRLKGRSNGPAFVNEFDGQSSTAEMNDLFIELLIEIYELRRELFAVDIKSSSDISEKYNVFRSFRRGSESRAVAQKVSEADRYVVNRWRKKEVAGTGKVSHPIDQHYVDVSIVKDSFLRYTRAM